MWELVTVFHCYDSLISTILLGLFSVALDFAWSITATSICFFHSGNSVLYDMLVCTVRYMDIGQLLLLFFKIY